MKNKALFIDRDGIINEFVYDTKLGIIHSPLSPTEVKLVPGIITLLHIAQKLGYLLIIVSNQPNIGLKKTSKTLFEQVTKKIHTILAKNNISIDAEYYCFHHPFALDKKYKKKCQCRKPNTFFYEKAIRKFSIDIPTSWTIGDGVSDIIAGRKLGLHTILVANLHETAYLQKIELALKDTKPHVIVKKLSEAAIILQEHYHE